MSDVISVHGNAKATSVWKHSPWVWGVLLAAAALVGVTFSDGLKYMVGSWEREEYSHGYLLPFIALFLVWQQKNRLQQVKFKGSWWGVLMVVLGAGLYIAGELSTLYIIVQYAFVLVLWGLALTYMGWPGFRIVAVPLLVLIFMIPLPHFLYNNLSAELQLISSQIGVWFIRLAGISVFLEGNVIDLGAMKLQVVEACDGLRYLFPLMTVGFIMALFYREALWKRIFIFISSIPITVLMNSLRIGIIGIMVEHWGKSMAEGFLHDFQGWAVFMVSIGVLLAEMWVLSLIGRERKPFREVFSVYLPGPIGSEVTVQRRTVPGAFWVAGIVMGLVTVASVVLPSRAEIVPERVSLTQFPLEIGAWKGDEDVLEQIYVDALKFDDYFIGNYRGSGGHLVNFYTAYYASQRKGESAHSPRSCLPGGGWRIVKLSQHEIPGVKVAGKPLQVNRTEIQYGNVRQLVYYWFQQRGRVITNEYLVKWFLFWDALTKNRTDGALVRLTSVIRTGEKFTDADRRMEDFAKEVVGPLERFIPN